MIEKKISYVRILKVEIENFKNIVFGKIEFLSNQAVKKQKVESVADVMGIYGQNGSGKTALIEALQVWKEWIQERSLPEELQALLKENTAIKMTFLVKNEEKFHIVEQEQYIKKEERNFTRESVTVYHTWNGKSWGRRKKGTFFLPILKQYAKDGLWIVTARQLGRINLNMGVSIDFSVNPENGLLCKEKHISLFEENFLPKEEMWHSYRMIRQMNIVLQSILPGLQITIKEHEEDGLVKFQFYAEREGRKFPLKYESGGLKRLISVLSILIAGYHSPSICVVIDEVDAGIFEFLLGELLEMMRNSAKGQFLFTSHNLRALEVLGREHIVFSTSNPENRFVPFSRIGKSKNLRDEYLRALLIGGQKEALYDEPKAYEMGYAFRKAGKLYDEF